MARDVNDASERLTRLEERYLHLQKHVQEQDRVILDLSDTVARLRQELRRLQNEGAARAGESAAGDLPADERPPHY